MGGTSSAPDAFVVSNLCFYTDSPLSPRLLNSEDDGQMPAPWFHVDSLALYRLTVSVRLSIGTI